MTWTAQQTRHFARQYKKLNDDTAADVNAAVDAVCQAPELGERKKGDLVALRLYRFHSGSALYLLGFTLDDTLRLV